MTLFSPAAKVSAPSGVLSIVNEFQVDLSISFRDFPNKFPGSLSASLGSKIISFLGTTILAVCFALSIGEQ